MPTCPGNSQPAASGSRGSLRWDRCSHNLLFLPHLHSPSLAAPSLLLIFGGLNYFSMWIWGCRNLTPWRDHQLEL